jgi:hypothetical protein
MGRSSCSDLSIPRSDSCAKKDESRSVPGICPAERPKGPWRTNTSPHTPKERRERERERDRDRERRIDNCVMPHYFEAMPAPCTVAKLVSPRDMERWWLASTVERLLVIDLATGPWLSVGCISICDSSYTQDKLLQASTVGWNWALAFTMTVIPTVT